MPTLSKTIESLASTFASEIIRAIRSASMEEILGETRAPRATNGKAPKVRAAKAPKRKARRLARRTPAQIQEQLKVVVALLKKSPEGLRSEEIRDALGLDRREVPRLLGEGLGSKVLKKRGQKRSTVYKAAV